jgi:hypothetical protein
MLVSEQLDEEIEELPEIFHDSFLWMYDDMERSLHN